MVSNWLSVDEIYKLSLLSTKHYALMIEIISGIYFPEVIRDLQTNIKKASEEHRKTYTRETIGSKNEDINYW